jgi:hypothetical protein
MILLQAMAAGVGPDVEEWRPVDLHASRAAKRQRRRIDAVAIGDC